MRAIVCSALMALTVTTAGAHAQGCSQNHELYRIVPEYRAIILDGGDKTLSISNEIDRALQSAWDYTNRPNGDPSVFLTEAKSKLGWYYKVCTDHDQNWFADEDFKSFLNVAASLTSINMAIDDPANESTYKARAAQYEKWREALYEAESKKGWARRIWERITGPH